MFVGVFAVTLKASPRMGEAPAKRVVRLRLFMLQNGTVPYIGTNSATSSVAFGATFSHSWRRLSMLAIS